MDIYLDHQDILVEIPQGVSTWFFAVIPTIHKLPPNCLSDKKCNIFADYNKIERSSFDVNTATNALNNDLKKVSVWPTTNKLSLNTEKTECVIIVSHQRL